LFETFKGDFLFIVTVVTLTVVVGQALRRGMWLELAFAAVMFFLIVLAKSFELALEEEVKKADFC